MFAVVCKCVYCGLKSCIFFDVYGLLITQRYSYLRNEAFNNASTLAGQIMDVATNSNVLEIHKEEKA
jgi:hypothetical protein